MWDNSTRQYQPAYLYRDVQGELANRSEILKLVTQQDATCVSAEHPSCYDRAYVKSEGWNSPTVDYRLRLSKDIQAVVERCESHNFAIAIATHGGSDFVRVQDSCPIWNSQCSQPSTCKVSKRCHVVQALQLQKMDPRLENNCDTESDFIQHNQSTHKDEMMIAILRNLYAQKKIDANGMSFKIWFFDDEGINRQQVVDSQANYSSVLETPVQICAFSPDEWTSYQWQDEGYRGNNLATGCDIKHIAKQIVDQPPWVNVTSTGCMLPKLV
jgi:hypothetical protein